MKMVQNSAVMSDTMSKRKFWHKLASQLELLIYYSLEPQKHSKMRCNIMFYCLISELDIRPIDLTLTIQNDILKVSTNNVHHTINHSYFLLVWSKILISMTLQKRKPLKKREPSNCHYSDNFHIFHGIDVLPKGYWPAAMKCMALISDRKQNSKTWKSWTFIVQVTKENVNQEVSFIPILKFHQQESKM
jgi:hypothetical protein